MPRKKRGQNLRNVGRLQNLFRVHDIALKKKKEKSSLTLSSKKEQPTAALDTSSSSSPF